jgi:hypothetical protein
VFIRILRGQAYDGAATLAEVNRWRRELGAGVLGWRRLTAGIGDGGELVLALRYDTEAAARSDRDPGRLAAMRAEVERTLRDRAPHVLGVTVAEHADGTGFTELTYLTSERESRAADRQMPVEMAVQLGTVRSYVEALEEVELRQPVLASPAVPVA